MRGIAALFVGLSSLALLPACTHIITQSAPYYEEGPNQPDPPEGDLQAGTKAWVLGSEGSYVRVWTDSGVNAWVWDRAVMTIWDYNKMMDEDRKRREAREKWLKAQANLNATQAPNGGTPQPETGKSEEADQPKP